MPTAPARLALTPLAVALPAATGEDWQPPKTLRLVPAGEFRARDGRPEGVDGWRLDAALAARAIEFARAQADDAVIDYEHQTLYAAANGQPAPAAGWWSAAGMQWRDGPEAGLYATDLRWTPRAEAMLRAGEYRYFSPVIAWDRRSGDVQAVVMGALTNYPGLDGLTDLSAAALSARFTLPTLTEDASVDLVALRKALALPDDADEAAILAAIADLMARAEGMEAEAATLKTQVATLTAAADPTQWVPLAVHQEAIAALRALSAQTTAGELDRLIQEGLSAGKIPGQATADWLRAQGLDGAKRWLADAPVLVALTKTQPHAGADQHALDAFTDALKAEFGSREAWEAYTQAQAAGRVRIANTLTTED